MWVINTEKIKALFTRFLHRKTRAKKTEIDPYTVERDWALLLGVAVFTTLLGPLLGTVLLWHGTQEREVVLEKESQENTEFDVTELRDTVESIEERTQAYHTLRSVPREERPTSIDPSQGT